MFSASKTAGPSGYNINNSLRFRSSASANLSRTPSSSTNRNTWTISLWAKRSNIGGWGVLLNSGTTTNFEYFTFRSDDTLQWVTYSGAILGNLITTQVFRDPSAWYHIVFAFDSTQATSSNRLKLYVNGSQVTAFGTASYPSLNYNSYINLNQVHNIGRDGFGDYFDGYMAEYNFIDGQALTPSSFGSTNATTGVWQPAKYTGSYGTNGFYLPFSDIGLTSGSNTGLGKDFSGNSNYWTTNNISVTSGTTYDAMTDSPTLTSATQANYAVMNPIAGQGNGTYSDGNLAYLNGVSATWKSGVGSLGVSSGKYYYEFTVLSVSSSNYLMVGAAGSTYNGFASYLGRTSDSWSFQWNGASSVKTNNDVTTTVSTAGSISVNDVLQVAIDMGTGSIWWGRNNTWVQGDPTAGTGASYTNLSGTVLAGFGIYSNGGDKLAANFGQRPFAYTPPTGYNRLNTFNLPTSTIIKGNTVMDATLYTGTGSAATITNTAGFQPDLVWNKSRNNITNNNLTDSVRGVTKIVFSNSANAEATASVGLTSFNSNGFSLASGGDVGFSANGYTYVAWQWQAGQGSTSSNTSGSITSTVSVNTTAGFSIVTYTGIGSSPKTVGHGLGVAPKMIFLKSRGSAVNWYVWHTSLGATQVIEGLNTTGAASSQITFNNTLPTSSVISLGNNDSNLSGANYVLYVWAEIAGFSAFGSYTGNGSTDGPFVFTNFRPKFVMTKRTDSISNWSIHDSSRATYNLTINELYPDTSDAEYTGTNDSFDFLSNGFKARAAGTPTNASGGTYIYAAFAENPFKNALAR